MAEKSNGIKAAEFRGMVLAKLDSIDDRLDKMDARFDKLDDKADCHGEAIAELKVRASLWGALGGALATLIAWLIGRGVW